MHARLACPGGALADAGSGHHRETLGPRPSRRGVECRESGPAARGPRAVGENGTGVPSILADLRADAGADHPEAAKTLENLAIALRKLGGADEAVSLELRAKSFCAKRS